MARITPRITPYVPKPSNLSPSKLAHSAPRAILTGNIPHPRIGSIPKLNTSPAKAIKPALSQLTTGAHTGRARKPNPKPKTPTQLTGYSTRAKPYRPPSSQAAQRPGIHSLQGAKMKIHRANPIKVPNLFHL